MDNVWNDHDVTSYLNGVAGDDETLARYLDMALHRALLKEDTLDLVTELPANAPEWMRRKWPAGGPYYEFSPTAYYRADVQHVADWIKAAMVNNEPWLRHVDDRGKPFKLNIGSLEEALSKADKAMGRMQPIVEGDGDTAKVMDFGDDMSIVHLLSPKALDYETSKMSHCIGRGAYDAKLNDDGYAYFSLRRGSNPHATLEVSKGVLTQCKGKRNKPPVGKYMPFIKAFLEHQRFDLSAAASQTGFIKVGDSYFNVCDLPANLTVAGNLNLSNTAITRLPGGLRVKGDLDLTNTDVCELPSDLHVEGNIISRSKRGSWVEAVKTQRQDSTRQIL